MAKPPRVKGTNVVVYVLIGLLIVGLAGFGIGGFTTSVRSIGSVGDKEITVDEYVRALQSQVNLFSQYTGATISAGEAIQLGLDRRALEAVILQAALDNETSRLGISVGDATVLQRLRSTPGFQGPDGQFDQDSYEFALERAGLSPSDYDEVIRAEETRSILGASVAAGIQPSDAYIDSFVINALGARDFRWVAIGEADLAEPVPEPSATEIKEHYDANPDEFTAPEQRHVTLVQLTPEMLADGISIDDEALRAEYEAREDQFNIPERRIVERLVFPDAASAQRARQLYDAGEAGFVELVVQRGISLADVDLGEVQRQDLSQPAGDLLFSSTETGVFGPVESELGPALYRVSAVLAARTTSFEDAREDLGDQLRLDLARDRIADSIEEYEDQLAGGATLEELAAETLMELSRMPVSSETRDGIARHAAFRNAVAVLDEDDFPTLANLPDGGIFAVRLDRIVPPELRPLDSARSDVVDSWKRSEVERLVAVHAEELKAKLEDGFSFEDLGLQPTQEVGTRRRDLGFAGPIGLADAAFGQIADGFAVFGRGEEVGIVRVDAVHDVDLESREAAELRSNLSRRYSASTGSDVVRIYNEYLQKSAGTTIDHSIISSIHAQFPAPARN